MTLVFKPDVRITGISPALAWMFFNLEHFSRCADYVPKEVMVTCIEEAHPPKDPHTLRKALDIRSHNFVSDTDKQRFVTDFMEALNGHPTDPGKFWGFLENAGQENEHFHFQVRKGSTFNP